MDIDYKVGEVECTYKRKTTDKIKVQSADEAFELMLKAYDEGQIEYRESFKVVLLNNNCDVLGYATISQGGITEASVDVRMIMQVALLTNATSMILVHNHPSGNLTPSLQDKELTKRIVDASRLMNIRVIDHVIISTSGYHSFVENGQL